MHNKIYSYIKNFIKNNYKDILFIIFLLLLFFVRLPYVIYKPGGSINISDRINIDNTEDSKGSYSMNYVSVSKGSIPALALSFIIPNWDIVKEEDITYEGSDYDTTFKIEKLELQNSIFLATNAAYQKAGKTINIKKTTNTIIYIDKDANTNLEVLDEIVSIDDIKYPSLETIHEYLKNLNIGDKVTIKVNHDGKEKDKYAYVYDIEGNNKIGIMIVQNHDYETNPELTISTRSSEAGASGGLMLSLAIYDGLIEEDLTHGLKIMGTGTINEEYLVGEIGGIKYKMLGAKKDKADIFFVPKGNYEEAKKVYDKYKFKYKLVSVETLDDAINYLKNIN